MYNAHPMARSKLLRQIWLEPSMPKNGISAARELCGMSDVLMQRLWEFGLMALMFSHKDGARPSPLWRSLIDATFAANN
jgi:hypothetical protein